MDRKPRSSRSPTHIYVRDRKTGEIVAIPTSVFPLEFIPEVWFENPFWMHSGYLSKAEVMKFLEKKPLTPDEAYKIGKYILLFAQNLACAGWLFSDDRPEYFEFMLPCIHKLHKILPRVKSREEVWEMLNVCFQYGLDPI
jgi:hypothetical protein